MLQNRVGKKTPVFWSETRQEAVCGRTIQDALGVGSFFDVPGDWTQVDTVPASHRVVIYNGRVLPCNDVTRAIATTAVTKGMLNVSAYGRIHSYIVTYVDPVRVIIA